MKIKQFTSLCLFLFLISSCVTEIQEENEANPSVEKNQLKQEQNLLINGNCDAKDKPASKPKTMASPPSLGIGRSCTSLSLTFAMKPKRSAVYLAIGVVK